jgi:hypothetical protein
VTILAVSAALLLPCWFLLLVCVPVLTVLAHRDVILPLLVLGPAEVDAGDVVMVVVGLRILAYVLVSRRWIRLPAAVPAFFLVLAASTALTYVRAGGTMFVEQSASLLRFASEGGVAFLLAHSLRSARHLDLATRAWRWIGLVIAASIYLDVVLLAVATPLGEVQVSDVGVRYFGPIGDQVGFLLPLFIFRELIGRRFLPASFIGVALLATGTRGALITLGVGLGAFVLRRRRGGARSRELLLLVAFGGALAAAFLLDLGSMLSRVLSPRELGLGWDHRSSCFELGLRMFLDNPVIGLGFTGFVTTLPRYYAPAFVQATFNQSLRVATDAGAIGLGIFVWMVCSMVMLLARAHGRTTGALAEMFQAAHLWLLGLALGNQTAAWLVPGSTIGYVVWLLIGMAAVVARDVEPRAEMTARLPLALAHQPAWSVPGSPA